MRLVLQRCLSAQVEVSGEIVGSLDADSAGLLLLVGIEEEDSQEDIDWLVRKVCNLRIFEDEQGVMGGLC